MERLLESLLALYRLLRTPQPLDSLLQAILDTAIARVPGAQRGSLMVREGEHLCYHATHGYDLAILRQVRFPAGAVNHMLPPGLRVSQVERFDDWDATNLDAETNRILAEHGHLHEIRRSLITSIVVAGEFYGTLVLDNLYSHAAFPSEAEALATLFAEQAGALIEHALLIEQLRKTNQLLAEAEQLASLGRLVAGVAHEINNPLTAVLGHAELLQEEALGAMARELLAQIVYGADRVRAIVRNLQIFARQQRSGRVEMDLNQIVEQTIALKRTELALDQIEVRRALIPDLPPTWGDAGQIGQVLLNLVGNAQHALRGQAPPRTLTIETALREEGHGAAGRRLRLSVADNGPGIAQELLGRIFEPFFTTKPVGQGTGLGLSVCYGIVADHEGRIWAEASPGGGALFVVELPVRAAPEYALDLPAVPPQGARPHGRRILLIDDDSAVVQLVRSALGPDNLVVVASEGAQALGRLASASFDLVLCDLKMPGMSGLDFFQQLQVAEPGLARRMLFISGDTSSRATRDVITRSGLQLLSKPFTPSELYTAIAALDDAAT